MNWPPYRDSSFVGRQFTFINSFDKTKCSVSDWLLFSCSGLLCLKRWVNGEIFAWNQSWMEVFDLHQS